MKTTLTSVIIALALFTGQLVTGQVVPCPAPTGLTVTAITQNSANLSWDNSGALKYQLSYCPMGNLSWKSITTTATSKTITNLAPGTTYSWLVRSVCPGTATNTMTTGPWSEIGYFTTAAVLPVCHASFVFNIIPNPAPGVGTGVQFHSTSTGISNTTQYAWDFGDNTVSTQQHPVHYYAQPGTYQVCLTITTVFSNNTVTCTDTWCHQVVIPAITPCLAPDNLQSSMITDQSALLDWSGTGAVMYLLRYRKVLSNNTGSPWMNITVQANTLALTNLVAATNYEWQVRGKCAAASGTLALSPWSASAFFITAAAPVNKIQGDKLFRYEFTGTSVSTAQIEVFGLTGALMYSAPTTLVPGGNEIDLDAAGLDNGIYLLRIRAADKVETLKFSYIR